MTATLQKCVSFANWCRRERLDPADAAKLCDLAHRAFKAGEREANTGKSADPARGRVEAHARTMRLKTRWPGLLPAFVRGDRTVYLPPI